MNENSLAAAEEHEQKHERNAQDIDNRGDDADREVLVPPAAEIGPGTGS